MAISQLDNQTPLQDLSRRSQSTPQRKTVASFAAMLAEAREGQPALAAEKAQAVAELLRLEQMRAVVDPFAVSSNGLSPSPPSTASLLLEALQAQTNQTSRSPSPPATSLPDLPAPPPAPVVAANVSPAPPPSSLAEIVSQASRRHGVDERLITAVIKAESNFNPRAVSHAGAQGLMQLMPATARGLGVTDPFDPYQNVMAGTRFLKDLLQRYGGNIDTALAAYNWGPGNIDRKGMALPRETRDYLAKVKTYYQQQV